MQFDFQADPFISLDGMVQWAEQKGLKDPNAMQVATVDSKGCPQVRTVLYKGLLREGLSFYTNYQSAKAQQIQHNSQIAVCFFWAPLNIQIRVSGLVKKLDADESDAYFSTRPRLSQLGAWASKQSAEIPDFQTLDLQVQEFDQKFSGQKIPRPPHWGGYHLLPREFEFWFGRQGRLHERYCFEKLPSGEWRRFLRSP